MKDNELLVPLVAGIITMLVIGIWLILVGVEMIPSFVLGIFGGFAIGYMLLLGMEMERDL